MCSLEKGVRDLDLSAMYFARYAWLPPYCAHGYSKIESEFSCRESVCVLRLWHCEALFTMELRSLEAVDHVVNLSEVYSALHKSGRG